MNVVSGTIALGVFGLSTDTSTSTMPALMLNAMLEKSGERQKQVYQEKPLVERQVEYFKEKIQEVETVDDVLDDYQLNQFLLQAFNLQELDKSKALLKKVLTDDPMSEDSFASRMNDPRFVKMAKFLRLDLGVDVVKSQEVVDGIVNFYHTVGFEEEIGKQNSAVREAMYFQRSVGDIETIYQLMGDKALKTISMTMFNIPQQVLQLEFDQQVKIFEERIDVKKLSDSAFVQKMTQEFLIRSEMDLTPLSGASYALAGFSTISSFDVSSSYSLIV